MNQLNTRPTMPAQLPSIDPQLLSKLVLQGDLSSLTPQQKVEYVVALCNRLGLDPVTQPLKLLKIPDKKTGTVKEVVYADRGCASQLNEKFGLSHQITKTEQIGDVFIVHDRCSSPDGRFTDEIGAVALSGYEGKALSASQIQNALMHARTKASRRSTLSHIGLGMLDETEAATIQDAQVIPVTPSLEWTRAERDEAKQLCFDLGDALIRDGWEHDAAEEKVKEYLDKIGEGTPENFANKVAGARTRLLAKPETVTPEPEPIKKPSPEEVKAQIERNWKALRCKWELLEPDINEVHVRNRSKKRLKDWTEGTEPKSEAYYLGILNGQLRELED